MKNLLRAGPFLALASLSLSLSAELVSSQPRTNPGREEFLRSARVVDATPVGKGITQTWRLTLQEGGWSHDASFQSVDEYEFLKEHPDGRREFHFVDSYRYNIAAYRLADSLGLDDLVPVSVQRSWRGRTGALTWWVDDVRMDETERSEKRLKAPDAGDWIEQVYRARVFAQLVHDTDRNLGNLLITNEWRLWTIDFTRAFRRSKELRSTAELHRCDTFLYEAMKRLGIDEGWRRLVATMDGILTDVELGGLRSRAERLVQHFDRLIRQWGRERVLY